MSSHPGRNGHDASGRAGGAAGDLIYSAPAEAEPDMSRLPEDYHRFGAPYLRG